MRVFLTGGTGFIGIPLTMSLLKRNHSVTVLVRKPDSPEARKLRELGASTQPGDILDTDSLQRGMDGTEAVIHNAGAYEFGITGNAKKQMWEINVTGTSNLLKVSAALKIPRIVYISSALAYGASNGQVLDETSEREVPALSFYEYTKEVAHHIALRYIREGTPLVIACPSHVIGPGDQSPWGYFSRLYVRGLLPPVFFAPDSIHTFIHREDAAEGITLVLEKGRTGESYFLAGGSATIRQIIRIWSKHPGGFKKPMFVPIQLGYLMGATAAPFLRLLGYPAFLSPEMVKVTDTRYLWSADKAERELGLKCRSVEQAWLDTLIAESTPVSE